LVDADTETGIVLGRLASAVAHVLRGKHRTIYAPNVDVGDFVVVVNAKALVLTGNKREELSHRHSGYPGGLKSRSKGELLEQEPAEQFRKAVRGMLPGKTLGRHMLSKLKVYDGPSHPHDAQEPIPVEFDKGKCRLVLPQYPTYSPNVDVSSLGKGQRSNLTRGDPDTLASTKTSKVRAAADLLFPDRDRSTDDNSVPDIEGPELLKRLKQLNKQFDEKVKGQSPHEDT
jgi:large subunit ribosomal protein L13